VGWDMPDWELWMARLQRATQDEADDLVDELTELILSSPPDRSATAAAIKALDSARSALSYRSAATAVAYSAGDDDADVVDHLERAFECRRSDSFLASTLLAALGLLALRNPIARAGAIRFLLRLKLGEPRPLLLAGAKVSGLLCDRENVPDLRSKLIAHARSDDPAVRAECLYQYALLRFADALLADSNPGLIASLTAAREAFSTTELSEESRPDATLFRLLIDAVLQFEDLERDRTAAAIRIRDLAGRLRDVGSRLVGLIFQMDRSPASSQVADRCVAISSALEAAAGEAAQASRWTNFDRSVVSLAECYGIIRYLPTSLAGNEQSIQAFSNLADRILKPRLGPVLARKVGRDSLTEVVRNHEKKYGKDGVYSGLLALQQAALEAEIRPDHQFSEDLVGRITAMAVAAGCTPEELVSRFNLQISHNGGDGRAVIADFLPAPPGHRDMRMTLPTTGIIVALTEEYDAIRLMIDNERRHRASGSGGSREYLMGDIPSVRGGIHRIIIAQTMSMGNDSAAIRVSKMLEAFDGIDSIIMCGISGGVPNPEKPHEHVRLGDVVISDRLGVVQYDFGKESGEVFEHRHSPRPPSARLLEAVQILEQDRLTAKRPWDEHLANGLRHRSLTQPDISTDVILDEAGRPVAHPTLPGPKPRIHLGPIASANVVQGDFKKRDRLRDKYKVNAVEMEGSGVADATWEYERAGYLVVRGVCDYCDVRTKATQTDAWKPYAAMVAAAYVRALLEAIPGG